MDIVEFLRARLDEDESAARYSLNIDDGGRIEETWRAEEGSDFTWGDTHEVTLWPERVLREVEAKRAILDQHPHDEGEYCGDGRSDYEPSGCGWRIPCPTTRALASAYADHPDYDPDWTL